VRALSHQTDSLGPVMTFVSEIRGQVAAMTPPSARQLFKRQIAGETKAREKAAELAREEAIRADKAEKALRSAVV
jgi:hypothetical protein